MQFPTTPFDTDRAIRLPRRVKGAAVIAEGLKQMDTDLEINDCREDAYPPHGRIPATLKEVGTARILNRRIIRREPKGSYGMGGTGFFGVQLEKNDRYPKEWLFLAYWGSYGWILLNVEPVDPEVRNPELPGEPLLAVIAKFLGPLSFLLLPFILVLRSLSQATKPQDPSDWSKLVGAKITAVDITESSTTITVEKVGSFTLLEIPLPGPTLRRGNRWILKGSHLEAWKVSRSGKIYC